MTNSLTPDLVETFPGDTPVSVREQKRLDELEAVIYRNFKSFYEVGCALREISLARLYRGTHRNFMEYVKDVWDLARARAYQLIDSADVIDNLVSASGISTSNPSEITDIFINGQECTFESELSTNSRQNESDSAMSTIVDKVSFPKNEAQARALAIYPPEKQIEIWQNAVASADGRISAAHIRATARRLHGEKIKKETQKAREKGVQNKDERMSPEFRAAFDGMLKAIETELNKGWKDTDPKVAARFLNALIQALNTPTVE
ncbi:hypothetical protein LJC47_00125 [Desulfosarcina sp. OttesenSCG-928-B08]|nr:hypothetical protein [Desulfosarcina sp. OttesenSCG-928-B08]